jgi:hypothetical protein
MASMFTVIETPFFSKLWPDYWTETERAAFAVYLAENPIAGDVIAGSGGCRKVRWNLSGTGKSGGVRVIYFNRLAEGFGAVDDVRQKRTRHASRRCFTQNCKGIRICHSVKKSC